MERPGGEDLYIRFKQVQDFALLNGLTKGDVRTLWLKGHRKQTDGSRSCFWWGGFLGLAFVLTSISLPQLGKLGWALYSSHMNTASKCLMYNNFIVKEITRPVTDCAFCIDVNGFASFDNLTQEQFKLLAYSSRPVIVRQGCKHWPALQLFSFAFFKKLYQGKADSLKAVEEDCQFFSFNTKFLTLEDVFNMPEAQANLEHDPWYIGWSNCDSEIAETLRQHYKRPHFLPDGSEASAIDWVFMGAPGEGASMHLDYVHRPSWQAQISGTKTWTLVPPPECEHLCYTFAVTVNKGDIVLIDTNRWYHDTFIHPGEMSITIGSEYD